MESTVRQAFLERRRAGIGGSDAAAVMGLDPYKTALDVYAEKLGLVPDDGGSFNTRRGNRQEPIAAALYAETTGRLIRRQPQRTHPRHPWMMCNADRQIVSSATSGPQPAQPHPAMGPGILEVKVPGFHAFVNVVRKGLPTPYIIQLQHNMAVYDYAWGSYAVFNADRDQLLWFDVLRDDVLIARMIEAEERFWRDHVLKKVPPVVEAPEPFELPEVSGQVVQRADAEWAAAAAALAEAQELSAAADELEADAKGTLKKLMGEYGVAEGAGLRAYWRQVPGRRSFDKKALAAAQPIDRQKLLAAVAGLPPAPAMVLQGLLRDAPLALDLAAFDKVGASFEEFRPYRLRPRAEE